MIDPRKILLMNRIAIFSKHPQMDSHHFVTHVHMSWPGFYNAISYLPEKDAELLLLSTNTAYDNSGVLFNMASMSMFNKLKSYVPTMEDFASGKHSIH